MGWEWKCFETQKSLKIDLSYESYVVISAIRENLLTAGIILPPARPY